MKRIATASGLLALALVACGTPDDEGALDTEEPLTEQPAAPATDAAAPAGAGGSVQVALAEWTVRPDRQSVDAGVVTFEVVNEGEYEHILEVEGQGIEQETEPIPPGGRTTLEVELQPGEYELYCPIEDETGSHEAQGMRTTLVVR